MMNFSEGLRESFRRLSGITWMAEELLRVTDYLLPTKAVDFPERNPRKCGIVSFLSPLTFLFLGKNSMYLAFIRKSSKPAAVETELLRR